MASEAKTFEELGLEREVNTLTRIKQALYGYSGTFTIDLTLTHGDVSYHVVDSNED